MKNKYTRTQGQYLAFIYYYTKLNRIPRPQQWNAAVFRTTPPAVHQMVLKMEEKGFISRTPRTPRSIRVLLPREQLPGLE
ncbi:MAG TPA: MarR family transcriptional regulator [Bacteroidetes bacterium]|nr:MarR family transcriptional regulator [Bacteroidota bacterium]